MLTIRSRIHVTDDGRLEARAPAELPAGDHDAVIVVDAPPAGGEFAQLFDVAEDEPELTATLLDLLVRIPTGGKQVHDADIVATMLGHGIGRLPTFDRADFARFESVVALEPA